MAPLTFHESVLDLPAEIDAGLAIKLLIVGGMYTLACAVTDPLLFLAVSV